MKLESERSFGPRRYMTTQPCPDRLPGEGRGPVPSPDPDGNEDWIPASPTRRAGMTVRLLRPHELGSNPTHLQSRGIRALLAALLVVALALGSSARAAAPEGDSPRGAVSSGGSFYVTWEPNPDPIPLNEMFEIRFEVKEAGDRQKLVEGAVVTADAYMPLHKHGTNLQPKIESLGDGKAVGRGFLLHMEGHWQLRVGIAVKGQMERATFDIQLEP